MPKRTPAIPDDILRREVGHLSDDVLLLPAQLILLTGLTVGQLKERQRRKPPQPPLPEAREKRKQAVWYSLGAVRRFRVERAEQAAFKAEVDAIMAKKRGTPGFSAWLATSTPDPWPIALLGRGRRPVDAWSTIRGEVQMARSDRIEWLTQDEYLDAMAAWVEATRVALEREAGAKLAASRLLELNARGTRRGDPIGRG